MATVAEAAAAAQERLNQAIAEMQAAMDEAAAGATEAADAAEKLAEAEATVAATASEAAGAQQEQAAFASAAAAAENAAADAAGNAARANTTAAAAAAAAARTYGALATAQRAEITAAAGMQAAQDTLKDALEAVALAEDFAAQEAEKLAEAQAAGSLAAYQDAQAAKTFAEADAAAAAAAGVLSDAIATQTAVMAAGGAAQRALAATADRQRAAVMGTTAATGFFVTALQTAHLLIGTFGANVIADAVGITAFGIAAVDAIGPVVTSLSTLTTSYGQLDNYQKAAALSLKSFLDSLGGNEVQVFTVFNQALGLLESRMGAAGGITSQASIAFMDFFAMLKSQFSSQSWVGLFSRSTGVIRADMDALFGLINQLLGVIPGLFHDFNSLGLGVINFAGGILHATAAVLNFDPTITKWAAGVGLAATAWHLLGNNISWIPAMGPVLGGLATDMKNVYTGARLAGQGMFEAGATALGAIPAFAAIAAAGIAFVEIANSLPDPVTRFVGALAAQDQAIGDNVAGYQRLSATLNEYLTHQKLLAAGMSPRDLIGIAQAQQQAASTARILAANFAYLGSAYDLNRAQAFQLAQATGVNLKQALTGSSQAAVQARDKIAAYEQTVANARAVMTQFTYDMNQATNASLSMSARIQGLTTAFSVLSGPLLQSLAAGGQFKEMLGQLAANARQANDVVGTATQKQAALSIALAQTASAAMKDSEAILNNTHSASAAAGPLIQMKDEILDLGLKGQAAAALVAQLNAEIAALHSKAVTLTTNIVTHYFQTGVGHAVAPGGYASGTPSAAAGLHPVAEQGAEIVLSPSLMRMRGVERVFNASDTARLLDAMSGTSGGGPQVLHLTAEIHSHLHADGQEIMQVIQPHVLQYDIRNGRQFTSRA